MDGNGRWAKQRGLNRTKGHEKGAEIIRDVTTYCAKHQSIETVTFYAFSTENWKRPKLEVDFLMRLLEKYLKNELETYQKNNVRFQAIGNVDQFSQRLQKRIRETESATKNNTALTHILALNYGGRAEITHTVNQLISEGKKKFPKKIFHQHYRHLIVILIFLYVLQVKSEFQTSSYGNSRMLNFTFLKHFGQTLTRKNSMKSSKTLNKETDDLEVYNVRNHTHRTYCIYIWNYDRIIFKCSYLTHS